MGIFSGWHWVIVLAVVVLVFGTKKIKNLGSDLGESIKGFKNAMSDGEKEGDKANSVPPVPPQQPHNAAPLSQPQTYDAQAHRVDETVKKD